MTPLIKLNEATSKRKPVTFRVGKIAGPDDLDRADFVATLREMLGADHKLEAGVDESEDPSSALRMLAFDVRQERHRINAQPSGFPLPRVARSGWRGAPPSMEAPLESEAD